MITKEDKQQNIIRLITIYVVKDYLLDELEVGGEWRRDQGLKGHRKVNVIYVVYIRINLLLNRNEDMLVIDYNGNIC